MLLGEPTAGRMDTSVGSAEALQERDEGSASGDPHALPGASLGGSPLAAADGKPWVAIP